MIEGGLGGSLSTTHPIFCCDFDMSIRVKTMRNRTLIGLAAIVTLSPAHSYRRKTNEG
jgi:hypothetical protein